MLLRLSTIFSIANVIILFVVSNSKTFLIHFDLKNEKKILKNVTQQFWKEMNTTFYMTSTNISHGFPIAILKDCLLPAISLDCDPAVITWVPLLCSEPFELPLPFPDGCIIILGPANEVRSLSEALLCPAAASFKWSEPEEPPVNKQKEWRILW